MKILNEIFAIKTLREARALGAVRQQDNVLAQAIVQRNSAQSNLQEFSQFAKHRETDLFKGLLKPQAGSVRLRDIQEVQSEVSVLRSREGEFKTELAKAEDRRNLETDKLVAFKVTHANAYREQHKFVELVQIHAMDEALRLERSEEGETETAAGPRALFVDTHDLNGGVDG